MPCIFCSRMNIFIMIQETKGFKDFITICIQVRLSRQTVSAIFLLVLSCRMKLTIPMRETSP